MDNFLNGFLKAWRTWRDDGKEAFMRAFLQEVQQNMPNNAEHFFEVLKQEMQAMRATRSTTDQQDILEFSNYIDMLRKEMEQTMEQTPKQKLETAKQQELQQSITILQDEVQEVIAEQLDKPEQELEATETTHEALNTQRALIQMLQEQQQTIQAMAQEIAQLKQQQHTQDNKLDAPQIETQEQELEQTQEDTLELKTKEYGEVEQQEPTQDIAIAQSKSEVAEELEQTPQAQESSEEQELLQRIAIFQDEIQEVLTEHPNRAEQVQEPEAKNLVEQKQESNAEQLSQPEQSLEVSSEALDTQEPKQTPPQAIEIDNKYAKLHSYFKQVELDVQQKRIKTKTDFKESFLNYAKSHMTEAELKVLLVLSQKQPSKLTQEHRNLINDALEQAHGNKHMQDLGLQLSVKAVLGHPLEAEQYTAIQNYVQQCQTSLEPMDGKIADAIKLPHHQSQIGHRPLSRGYNPKTLTSPG
ncbi:coiled-coil domain-containing protein [Helicobacter labacensis]|uniref:hypothetical protein n=1 Tax=Helicobacter labacensis TaxID=2316079 RepID=UPI000EB201C5|nr:hypothetical protein [Helicobacter labacensis]